MSWPISVKMNFALASIYNALLLYVEPGIFEVPGQYCIQLVAGVTFVLYHLNGCCSNNFCHLDLFARYFNFKLFFCCRIKDSIYLNLLKPNNYRASVFIL